MKKKVFAVILSTIWISFSEFLRNEFILKNYWIEHYRHLGLSFPSAPLNGAVWGIWSLCFALIILIVSRRFSFRETVFISWISGFVLMWLVIGNLLVLPFSILPIAIPLSFIEVLVVVYIIKKMTYTKE